MKKRSGKFTANDSWKHRVPFGRHIERRKRPFPSPTRIWQISVSDPATWLGWWACWLGLNLSSVSCTEPHLPYWVAEKSAAPVTERAYLKREVFWVLMDGCFSVSPLCKGARERLYTGYMCSWSVDTFSCTSKEKQTKIIYTNVHVRRWGQTTPQRSDQSVTILVNLELLCFNFPYQTWPENTKHQANQNGS